MAKRLTKIKQMSKVNYHINQSPKETYKKRFRIALVIMVASLIILAILSIIGIYVLSNINKQNSSSLVGSKTISHIAGPKLFKNQFFEFYSSNDWRLDSADSSSTKVTYTEYNDGVVDASFVVYINQTPIPNDLGAEMALPVVVNGSVFSHIGNISENCGQTYAPNALKRIEEINISSTSMLCVPDSSQYRIILGAVGGDYQLKMTRSNGQTANYIIIYTSSSYTPSSVSFMNLIPTFKAL